jgi:hypothetical protein
MDSNITYEEFEELCREAIRDKEKAYWLAEEGNLNRYNPTVDLQYYTEGRWSTGGQGGGSCWDEGESHYYALEGEQEPKDEYLSLFLLKIVPELTYAQFVNLEKSEFFEYSTEYQNEYYGNYTTYGIRKFNLRTLYDVLKQMSVNG